MHLLRFGSHAEKSFFSEGKDLFDMVLFNANLAEYTAKAISSFLFGPLRKVPYLIDPGTHAFGHDPQYIMRRRRAEEPESVKKSVAALAEQYGDPVVQHLGQRPLEADDFRNGDDDLEGFCRRVLDFQIERLQSALNEDVKYLGSEPLIQPPFALIPPYFYMTVHSVADWLPVNIDFINLCRQLEPEAQLFAEIVVDKELLDDQESQKEIVNAYSQDAQCDGYLLWISSFSQHTESLERLMSLMAFTSNLAQADEEV